MSKRRDASAHNVATWIKRGDGQGEGPNYRPFLHVRDVPSRGRSSIGLSLKTGRTHHYLSDLEYKFHILAEHASHVEDIREQFALLPWEETQEIAKSLNIRHSVYPFTKTPIVMTSDIVLTLKSEQGPSYAVVSIKPASELKTENKSAYRVLEKLLIEKTYWERRGIPWKLLTEENISHTRFHNLNNLRTSIAARELDWLDQHMLPFITTFNENWHSQKTLNDILDITAEKLCLDRHNCFMLFGRSVWRHLLPVDLDTSIIRHKYPVQKTPTTPRVSSCLP